MKQIKDLSDLELAQALMEQKDLAFEAHQKAPILSLESAKRLKEKKEEKNKESFRRSFDLFRF